MKLKSMISWALIFSFTFLLFQPLTEANGIESAKIKAQVAELNAKYQRIDQDLKNYQQKSQMQSALTKKAKAQDLMFNPDTEDMSAQADESGNGDQSPGSTSSTAVTSDTSSTISTPDSSTTQEISSLATTDPSGNANEPDVAVILQAPDKVTLGSVAAILVTVWVKDGISEKIDKINVSVQESSGNVSFKDSFVNYKDQTKFSFTYNWDTYAAQSKADKGGAKHKIIIEAYQKSGDQYTLFKKSITKDIEVIENQWDGLGKDGFWNSYIEQNGTLSDYWLKKLECQSQDDCKTRTQIQEHLSAAVDKANFQLVNDSADRSSEFNDDDGEKLFDGLASYRREVDAKTGESNEEMATESLKLMIMADFMSYTAEIIDTKRGYEMPQIPKEVVTSLEMQTVFAAIDKRQIKFASYGFPSTQEEIKALPFWPEMEKEIADNIAKNPENSIASMEELQASVPDTAAVDSAATSFLRPQKAHAILPLLAVAGVIVYVAGWVVAGLSIYKAFKEPTAGNITWAIVNTAFAAFGGKIVEWGALALGKAGIYLGKALKITPWLTNVLKPALKIFWNDKVAEGILKMTYSNNALVKLLGSGASKLYDGLSLAGRWIATQAGALKKILIAWGKIGARIMAWLGLTKAQGWWSDSACPGIKILIGPGLDPFAWALCNMLKFFFDLGASIYGYANCLLKNALGIGTKPTQCEIKFGPTS